MSEKRYLAFDFGAESGRAIVGTIKDNRLEMEEIHRFPTKSMFVYGTRRWNIYRLYEEIIKGMIEYVNRFGNELESIGIDTWGVDYGFLSKDGTLLELPYQYRDTRTSGTEKILNEAMGNKEIYNITGIQFMTINTLNQMVAVKSKDADILGEADRMLFIGDILHYLLCGNMASEFTVASTSQMLDAVDKEWSDKIFSDFGFPDKIKPKIIFAGDVLGYLDKDIAKEVGLKNVVKIVVPAVHDTASAATSIPAKGDDWAYISSGTWCMVGMETDAPVINDASYEMNISNSGGALGKNLFLKNVMGLWIIQQCKKAWNRTQPGLDYPEIVKKAITAAPFIGFIDPDDDLFFAPANNIEAVKNYFDKTDQKGIDTKDIGTIARIVYESLALKYRYVVDRLKATTKKDVNVLHIIGGGVKNKLLNQFTANALGIKVITGPVEATATGNLLLQAYGCGATGSLDEIRHIVRNSNDFDIYVPENSLRNQWEAAYLEFKKICRL